MIPPGPNDSAIAEEIALLAQAGAGDRDAFRRVYARYSGPLFALAVRLVGDPGDAEELLQDAFVKIWRNAAAYDARKSRPFTWVVTILRRTCIDHLRKRRRAPVTTPMPDGAGAPPDVAGADAVRLAVDNDDEADRLRGALAEIPPGQRSALELALFSDLTHAEIARRLEQPPGTVKSWIRRGLLGLRATLNNSAP